MSGELTLSQFRYTTTNNRDLVIGDPTNTAELLDPKYIVFQTNTTPGYAANPYIGVTYNSSTSTWQLQFSSNGVSSTSFAQLSLANTFSASNIFNGTTAFNGATTFSSTITASNSVVFNSNVTFNNSSAILFNSPVTVSGAMVLSSTLSVSQASNFSGLVTLTDGITLTGTISLVPINSVISLANTIAVNYSGTSSASVGSGLVVYGSSSIIASILTSTTTTPSDTWTILPATGHSVSFMGDSSYTVMFKSPGLTAARTYQYPNNSGIFVINPGTFSGGKLLLSSSDNTSVTESAINASYLSGLTSNVQTQINSILSSAGGAVVGTTGTFSGALSASSLSLTGALSATSLSLTGAIVGATSGTFSSVLTASSLTLSGGISATGLIATTGAVSATGSVSASSFSGAGTGLTGTASSLSVGYASSAGSVPYSGITGKPFTTVNVYGTSGRSFGTQYTNNTAGPMFVTITVQPTVGGGVSDFYVYINGILSSMSSKSTNILNFDDTSTCSFIVPQGSTYQANLISSPTISNLYWMETHN